MSRWDAIVDLEKFAIRYGEKYCGPMSKDDAFKEIILSLACQDGTDLLEGLEKAPGNVRWIFDAIDQIITHMRAMEAIGLLDEYKEKLFHTGLER